MEKKKISEQSFFSPPDGINLEGDGEHFPNPDYTSSTVREALERLSSIELIELCAEAKIENCRATRDLSSCGRYVQHLLTSCGHASLCAECSQRCSICPICRTEIPKIGRKIQLRLYNVCVEAGLINESHAGGFQDNLMDDISRLYSLFDVALENNLVSLVNHYVTDVCMDESAVSSDPVLAFLLDEVVVKDWCKKKFDSIVVCLHGIYALGLVELDSKVYSIKKLVFQLSGLVDVLEVLESSSIQTHSEYVRDLQQLSDDILKAKQHSEVILWCIKHRFLENICSRHKDHMSWTTHVRERKYACVKRAWLVFPGNSSEQSGSTLFIEDALSNLSIEDEVGDTNVLCLQEDINESYTFPSTADGMSISYPFLNLRAAVDALFLHGTPDMMVAKQAIFLYYLFDRHWTMPDVEWRYIVDDFAASFGIRRLSVLESLSFYLLDDHTEQALQTVEHILQEIAGPETHTKIAQVLIERQRPNIAQMVLCCSGQDGFSGYANSKYEIARLVSLEEATTAIRVRIECGFLTEAFMYQRTHCMKVKKWKLKHEPASAFSNSSKSGDDSWIHQVKVLVTELCSLCIRRNMVDRMIELPWNSDEEKYLCKCLYANACRNPSSTCGSLLVVFYLQRCRYFEACQVHRKLTEFEDKFSATNEIQPKILLIRQWRTDLVDKAVESLPEVQRLQAKRMKFDDLGIFFSIDANLLSSTVSSNEELPNSSPLQMNLLAESSLVLPTSTKPFLTNGLATNKHPALEFTGFNDSSIFCGNLTTTFRSSSPFHQGNTTAHEKLSSRLFNGRETTSTANDIFARGVRANNCHGQESHDRKNPSSKKELPVPRPMTLNASDMDLTQSVNNLRRNTPAKNFKTGPRWRSDESSDEEMEINFDKIIGRNVSFPIPSRRHL